MYAVQNLFTRPCLMAWVWRPILAALSSSSSDMSDTSDKMSSDLTPFPVTSLGTVTSWKTSPPIPCESLLREILIAIGPARNAWSEGSVSAMIGLFWRKFRVFSFCGQSYKHSLKMVYPPFSLFWTLFHTHK